MTRTIILASVMLIALSGAASAGTARAAMHWSAVHASRPPAERFNNFAAFTSGAKPYAYHYHGGPKSYY
jgi:hypothetical protein